MTPYEDSPCALVNIYGHIYLCKSSIQLFIVQFLLSFMDYCGMWYLNWKFHIQIVLVQTIDIRASLFLRPH